MSELKTKKNDASVENFLRSIEDEQQRADSFKLLEVFKEATRKEPKMWGPSIVGFGEKPYKRSDGSEHSWMLTGFSPRKQNLTLYIMTGFEEYAEFSGYDPKPLLDKLGPYKTGKSCLYIKRLSDVDEEVLRSLIKNSVAVQRS